ncbi:MAG: hypothetical protein PVJ21_02415 [Anaerolineales bacterium]|jgi:hypothetical protein
MKCRILSPFLLLLTISACTTINRVEPDYPTPLASFPSVEAGSLTFVPSTYEQKDDNIQMTQVPIPSGLQGLIDKAKEELSQRLSIELTEISLTKAEEVVWSNASLGCPQPGMVYAEVLTPGYLILLEVNNMVYEYHASRGTEVIYCENPMPPVEGTPLDQ